MPNMNTLLQSEAAECGLASIAMVANAHGLGLDLSDLRRRCIDPVNTCSGVNVKRTHL